MGKHFPLPLLTPYAMCSLYQSPHQCGVHIGLHTLSSRQGFRIGYRMAKGVSEMYSEVTPYIIVKQAFTLAKRGDNVMKFLIAHIIIKN